MKEQHENKTRTESKKYISYVRWTLTIKYWVKLLKSVGSCLFKLKRH